MNSSAMVFPPDSKVANEGNAFVSSARKTQSRTLEHISRDMNTKDSTRNILVVYSRVSVTYVDIRTKKKTMFSFYIYVPT